MLKAFGAPDLLIGLLSSTRSIEGVVIQPTIGAMSDRVWTRFGRRRVFILIGVPLSAAFFIAGAFTNNLAGLALVIFLFSIFFNVAVDPYTALLADIAPIEQRGLLSGLATGVQLVSSVAFLVLVFVATQGGNGVPLWIYFTVAATMLVSFGITFFGISEPRELAEGHPGAAERIPLRHYVEALLEQRRAVPAGDLLSTLLAAREERDRLSHPECVNLVLNVLAGGIDTTQSQLAHAMRLFAEHPDQWALLATHPELIRPAVSEVLRFEPITPFTARICVDQLEHRGVVFPPGTIVAVCAERANREQAADEAGPAADGDGAGERFDITLSREDRLLTFGAGPHFCLGSNLARAELEEALTFLVPRMPGLAPDGPAELGGVEGIYGVVSLPLRWSAG